MLKTLLALVLLALCTPAFAANEHIIIGDSLCTFIDNASKKANRLAPKGDLAGTHLWYGGTTLTWLKSKIDLYPVSPDVRTVIISTGTNSAYSKNDDIPGLVNSLRTKFPGANLIVVPGSWWIKQPRGWVVTVSEETVKEYYARFEALGVRITTPVGDSRVCCANDPHGNFPIYQTIGAEIDAMIGEEAFY
jgi:hypothetical protein